MSARVEIFTSGPQCTHCTRAKKLLGEWGIPYRELNVLEDDSHRDELLERLPRAKAMPQIFVGGEHIGSTEDLVHLESNGNLASLLDE